MKLSSGQSGVDSLLSSGWVVIVGVCAIIVLSQMGAFRSAPCSKNSFGFSQVVPTDWAAYRENNIAVISIENWAGDPVDLSESRVSIGDVTCSNVSPITLNSGDRAILVLECSQNPGLSDKYLSGDCYTGSVSFTYFNARTQNPGYSKGKVSGPVEDSFMSLPSTSSIISTSSSSSTTVASTRPLLSIIPLSRTDRAIK